MNRFALNLVLASCFLVLGSCSHSGFSEHGSRNPATTKKAQRCVSWFMDLAEGVKEDRGVWARYKNHLGQKKWLEWRGRPPELIEADLANYRKSVWALHDNTNIEDQILKGDSGRRQALLQKLKRKNKNPVIPAYYQFWDGKETWPVIRTIELGDTSGKEAAEAFESSYQAALKWVDEYKHYEERLNTKIDEGFQAKLQLQGYERHQAGGVEEWKFNDFRGNKSKSLTVPKVVDGKVVFEESDIRQHGQFLGLVDDAELNDIHIFSRGFLDEATFSSEIYQIQIEQAHMFRRLSFLRDKLDALPNSKMTREQKILMDDLDVLLDKPEYYPPSTAVMKAQKKEIQAEVKAIKTGRRSKNKIRSTFKHQLPPAAQAFIKEKSHFATHFKRYLFALLPAGTYGVYQFWVPDSVQNPYVAYPEAYITNNLNQLVFKIWGSTKSIEECAAEFRTWTKFEVCFNKIVWEHTSTLFFKSRMDPNSPDYRTLPEFTETRKALARAFLESQFERRNVEFHIENKEFLEKIAIPMFADDIFMDMLVAKFELKTKDIDTVDQLLSGYAVQSRTPWTDKQLTLLRTNNPGSEVADEIVAYFKAREAFVEELSKRGRIDSKNLDEFKLEFKVPPISEELKGRIEGNLSGDHHEGDGHADHDEEHENEHNAHVIPGGRHKPSRTKPGHKNDEDKDPADDDKDDSKKEH